MMFFFIGFLFKRPRHWKTSGYIFCHFFLWRYSRCLHRKEVVLIATQHFRLFFSRDLFIFYCVDYVNCIELNSHLLEKHFFFFFIPRIFIDLTPSRVSRNDTQNRFHMQSSHLSRMIIAQ